MEYAIIFCLGIAVLLWATIYDARNTKDAIIGACVTIGFGACIFGLVMSVASLFA